MSFPFVSGILTPPEFEAVQAVYTAIAAEPWFTVSGDKREQFALVVLDAYRMGIVSREMLASYCRDVALVEFGNGGLIQ